MSIPIPLRSGSALHLTIWGSLLVTILGCQTAATSEPQSPTAELPTRRAEVFTVQLTPWPTVVRSQGVLVADEVGAVGAKVAGSVAKVHVELGDTVFAGDVLVELDREEFDLQVHQAEAQLAQARSSIGLSAEDPIESLDPENSPPVRQEKALWDAARATLQRVSQLRSQNAVSALEFDQAVADERVAEARYAGAINATLEKIALVRVREVELALARDRLKNSAMLAPFDAVVERRLVAPGDYVQVGDQIAALARTNPLRYRGNIPEHHAQRLAVGQEVRLQVEGMDQPYVVEVTRISPALEQASRSLMFEAELANEDQQLRSGLFAQSDIVVDPQAVALIVPNAAVVEFAGAEKVWKVVEGVATEQEVLLGQRREGGIEVLQGLEVGDIILSDGSQAMVARIEPIEPGDERPDRQEQTRQGSDSALETQTSTTMTSTATR